MIARELLDILVCPETKQPVRELASDELAKVKAAMESGQLKTRTGQAVSGALDGGILREDAQVVYPIRDDIPVMLIDEGVDVRAMGISFVRAV